MVFNAMFNNISIISVILWEETRVPGQNHQPDAGHLQTLSQNVVSCTPRHSFILYFLVALMSKNYCISITVLVFQEMINYLLIVYISIGGYNIPYKWVFSREPKFVIFFQIGWI